MKTKATSAPSLGAIFDTTPPIYRSSGAGERAMRELMLRIVGGSISLTVALGGCSLAHNSQEATAPGAGTNGNMTGPVNPEESDLGSAGMGNTGVAGAAGNQGIAGSGGTGGTDGSTPPPAAELLQVVCDETASFGSAPGLGANINPDQEFAWLAERQGPTIYFERGTPCATASDVPSCTGTLDAITPDWGYHFATTAGDVARIWTPEQFPELFGTIDTPEEALAIVLADDDQSSASCPVDVLADTDGSFLVQDVRRDGACGQTALRVDVRVQPDATLADENTRDDEAKPCPVAVPGRRPAGLYSAADACRDGSLAAHFAAMFHDEAASVPAFGEIARELRAHGAPRELWQDALRARDDERRHARIARHLAARHGAHVQAPRVAAVPVRSLYQLALDNALEGCVNETYAAACATHQACHAADPTVREAMASVARDEIRHADFSHRLHAWLMPRLTPNERAQIQSAQRRAVDQLADQADKPVAAEVQHTAGMPGPNQARALHAGLASTLWAA